MILDTALTQPSPRYACRLSISPMVEAAPQLGKASPTLKHAGSTFGVGARVDGPLVAESIRREVGKTGVTYMTSVMRVSLPCHDLVTHSWMSHNE